MLSKKERLTRADFDRFFKSGRRSQNAFFTLVYTPSPVFHGSVVVGKKVSQKAVVRNRIRRRMYHVLRAVAHTMGKTGVFIILMKKDSLQATPTLLRHALTEVLGSI